MIKEDIEDIINSSRDKGWVMEPEAKHLLALAGIRVPIFKWTEEPEEVKKSALEIGYPVVAKVVSSRLVHKSDAGGVSVGIESETELMEVYSRFARLDGFSGILIEEMLSGLEIIVGAKIDYQFGPVILLGIGGTGVEIYRDITLRMAPISHKDVGAMVASLKAHQLLEGYRRHDPINLRELSNLMVSFSDLLMYLEDKIESIDLNPVICSSDRCVVADARIMLKTD